MAESLDLARASVADGITHAVMTPHIHPGRYENTRTSVVQAVAEYRAALNAAGIALQIYSAGEVRLSSDIIDLLAEGELPFLGTLHGYRVLLLEFPYGQIPVGTEKLARWLLAQKIRPLIAHPERNKSVMQNPEKLRVFIDMGCLLQVTAGSLLGDFGKPVQDCAVAMLDQRWVSLIASDAHNLLHRAPVMTPARNWLIQYGGLTLADELTVVTPAKILGLKASELAGV